MSLTGLGEAISNAINILSLTGHLPRIIHKFAQNSSLLLCSKVFRISSFKTLFFKKSLKPGRIIQDLVNNPDSVPLGTKYL